MENKRFEQQKQHLYTYTVNIEIKWINYIILEEAAEQYR